MQNPMLLHDVEKKLHFLTFLIYGFWGKVLQEKHLFPQKHLLILKSYKNIITNSENTKRLENLIWRRQWSSANRQLKRVSSDIKQFSIAKIKLSRRRGNVDQAIKNVPRAPVNAHTTVAEN